MGLHPSIRSLLAANAGFTTGNVISQQKQKQSFVAALPLPFPLPLPTSEINQFFMLTEPN